MRNGGTLGPWLWLHAMEAKMEKKLGMLGMLGMLGTPAGMGASELPKAVIN